MFIVGPIIRLSGLNVTIINTTTVAARWDPIPREHVFGNLIGYSLSLYAYGFTKYFKTNETSIVVKDLQPGHSYRLYVYGYTAKDKGEQSYYSFVTRKYVIHSQQHQYLGMLAKASIKFSNHIIIHSKGLPRTMRRYDHDSSSVAAHLQLI